MTGDVVTYVVQAVAGRDTKGKVMPEENAVVDDVTEDTDVETTDTDVDDVEDDAEEADVKPADDDYTPPSREEYEKLLATKRRATKEAADRRKFLREAGIDHRTGKRLDGSEIRDAKPADDGDKVDRAAIEAEALSKVAKAEAKALKFAVSSQLRGEGLSASTVKLLLPQIDLADLSLEDSGEIEGFEDALDRLKEDYPELFAPKASEDRAAVAKTTRASAGANRASVAKPEPNFTQRLINASRNAR